MAEQIIKLDNLDQDSFDIGVRIPGKIALKLSADVGNQLKIGSDGGLYVGRVYAVNDTVASPLIKGVATLVDVTANDQCSGTAWSVVSMNNCTATHTTGGTFSVLVGDCSLGAWSFDYEVTCQSGEKSVGKVSGTVATGTQTHVFNFSNTTTANLALVLSGGGTYTVDWGDGSPADTATSSTSAYATKTYSSPYTGAVTVTFAACSKITELRSALGTLTGDVGGLPSGLTLLNVTGSNTLTGDVSGLPAGLTYLSVTGSNTLTGDVSDLPSGLTLLYVTGSNTLTAPVQPVFATSMRYILIRGISKSTAFVDTILAAAANVSTWTNEKLVDLRGTNAAPSGAGLASKATILSNGATSVLHN